MEKTARITCVLYLYYIGFVGCFGEEGEKMKRKLKLSLFVATDEFISVLDDLANLIGTFLTDFRLVHLFDVFIGDEMVKVKLLTDPNIDGNVSDNLQRCVAELDVCVWIEYKRQKWDEEEGKSNPNKSKKRKRRGGRKKSLKGRTRFSPIDTSTVSGGGRSS